ncbi:insulinase family protein [Pedobacter foliorum]|uniref:insulinase family protein n=1 Tax=Pedobacter foliorum TaxID=2739058 RepID=UPI001565FD6F|nr:insulinase family protein [Pedobacter foliorum]NRF40390.1 insulinase family protein [Pedobacter foliorum]
MKTIKNFIILIISVLSIQFASAQSTSMQDPVSFKLKNGLTIIVAENQDSKKIYAGFTADEESAESSKAGVQDVFNAMMNFSDKGGNIAANTSDFAATLMTFSKSIQEPVLNQASFETALAKVITSVNARDRYYPETITETSVKTITLNDIKAFYSKNIIPSNTYLTIAGNISASDAKALAKKFFGEWNTRSASELLVSK